MRRGAPCAICHTSGSMAEFRTLSLAKKRLHLKAHPQQVGRIDCVALVEDALLASMQHWPRATEVVGVPLTERIACTLGMQLSILKGKKTRTESAQLATRWPGGLWTFITDVVDSYR